MIRHSNSGSVQNVKEIMNIVRIICLHISIYTEADRREHERYGLII